MKNLKISTKLYMTLILYSTVFIAVGISWIITLGDLNKEVESLVNDREIPMNQLQTIEDAYSYEILATLESLQDSSISDFTASNLMTEGKTIISSKWEDYLETKFGEAEEKIIDGGLSGSIEESLNEITELIDLIGNNADSLSLTGSINRIAPLSNGIILILDDLSTANSEFSESPDYKDSNNNDKETNTRNIIIIIVLIMLFGPGIMAITMILGIGKSIKQIGNALDQISNGDLKIKFHSYGRDELGGLMVKLEKTSGKLQEVISSVRVAAMNMSHASSELSSVSQDVAQGASEQASTSEEIASSVEEISGNIQQNSVNADETDAISARSFEKVQTVFDAASSSLTRIVEISEKVSIIGEIAFQTNILSLNAAVEAARAGEHGRGFGVVATEVGKLADRSKNAANEINELSKLTVNVTEESGKLLSELIPDIEKTSELVKQISASSQEQNLGSGQINIAVQQLSMVTQQNAASSEEMATSAAEMSSQAKQLLQTMSFFSIDKNNDGLVNSEMQTGNAQRIIAPADGVKIDLSENDSLDKDFMEF